MTSDRTSGLWSSGPGTALVSLQAGCKGLLFCSGFLWTFWRNLIPVRRSLFSFWGTLELLNDEYNYILKGHLPSVCCQPETIPRASSTTDKLIYGSDTLHGMLQIPMMSLSSFFNWTERWLKTLLGLMTPHWLAIWECSRVQFLQLRRAVTVAVFLSTGSLLTVAWLKFMNTDKVAGFTSPCTVWTDPTRFWLLRKQVKVTHAQWEQPKRLLVCRAAIPIGTPLCRILWCQIGRIECLRHNAVRSLSERICASMRLPVHKSMVKVHVGGTCYQKRISFTVETWFGFYKSQKFTNLMKKENSVKDPNSVRFFYLEVACYEV